MNKIFTLFFLAVFLPGNAQEPLTTRDFKKLNELGITFEIQNNVQKSEELSQILRFEKNRKSGKAIGIVLTSLSAAAIGIGTATIMSNKDDHEGLGETIGGVFIGIGGVGIAGSIPFFLGSRKNKKRRDAYIKEYKNIQ